jgi:TolB-like protein
MGIVILATACAPAAAPINAGGPVQSVQQPSTPSEAFDDVMRRVAVELNPRPGRIAILDFPDLNQQQTDAGRLISQALTTAIVSRHTPGLVVLERLQIDEILKELSFRKAVETDSEYVRIGRALGADAVVFGTAQTSGADVILFARMVDVGSRSIIAASQAALRVPSTTVAAAASPMTDRAANLVAAPPPKAAPTLHQRKDDWDVAVDNCRRESSLLQCDFTFTNRGRDRTIWINACQPNVMIGQLPYCTRGYFSGSIVSPFSFDHADMPKDDGNNYLMTRFTVLANHAVKVGMRLENPPSGAVAMRQLDVFLNSPFGAVSFMNVPIATNTSVAQSRTLTSLGFEFSTPQCKRQVSTDVVCQTTVVNHGREQLFGFNVDPRAKAPVEGTSRAFDADDKAYFLTHFRLSAPNVEANGNGVDFKMPSNDSVQLLFSIENVPATAESFKTLELLAIDQWGDRPAVRFRDVPISR